MNENNENISSLNYEEFLKIIKPDEDNQKPSFWSQIPASVRYSKKITEFQKLLFSEILALSHVNYDKEGRYFCHANNNYFARVFEKNKVRISEAISNLQIQGFIYCQYIYENKECKARLIYVNEDYFIKSVIPITENRNTPITEIVKYTSINNNNTSVNGEIAPPRIDFEIENRSQSSLDIKKYTSTYENWDTVSFEKCILYWISKLTANTPTSLEMILSEHERMRLKNNFENRNSNCGIAILEAVDYAFKFDVRFRLKNFIDFLNINLLETSKSLDMPRKSEGQDVGYNFDYCVI